LTQSGDVAGGDPIRLAIGLDPAVGEARDENHTNHRQQQDRRRPGVGHAEDDTGDHAEHEPG
jgi:hypothetical protein